MCRAHAGNTWAWDMFGSNPGTAVLGLEISNAAWPTRKPNISLPEPDSNSRLVISIPGRRTRIGSAFLHFLLLYSSRQISRLEYRNILAVWMREKFLQCVTGNM